MDFHLENKIKSDVHSRACVPKILFRDPWKVFNSAGKRLFTARKTVVGCGSPPVNKLKYFQGQNLVRTTRLFSELKMTGSQGRELG